VQSAQLHYSLLTIHFLLFTQQTTPVTNGWSCLLDMLCNEGLHIDALFILK